MACCSDPGGCGGDRPFPWFSALRDSTMRRLFLMRYRRELLLGLGAGTLTTAAALAFGEGLGDLGLRGPWFHVHGAAAAPAFLLGGLTLALSLPAGAAEGWGRASVRALGWVLLGGLANAFLEAREGSLLGGALVSLLAFGLGLPVLWLAWGALAAAFRSPSRAQC